MTISRVQMKDQSFSPTYKLICQTNIKMKMKWNFTFTGEGCQLAARSLKLYALAKLRSIDSCQNGTREDHYQITTWAPIHNLPDWNVLLTPAINSPFIRKFVTLMNFNQLTAVKLQHPVTIITWTYRGLRYRPTEFELFWSYLADKLLLFKWLQAQVQFF